MKSSLPTCLVDLSRRHAVAWLAVSTLPLAARGARAAESADVANLLRAGGCVVMLRHAATVAGVGDPPGFRLDACSTQRNLSEAGQQDARRIGEWFRASGLKPRAVLSSAWCRCKDTADLAFGAHKLWAPLNSTFIERSLQPDQSRLVRQGMAKVPAGQFEVWVTHQVNISALAEGSPASGEAFVFDRQGKVLARTTFA